MELPLQIATRNVELSPADAQMIRDGVAKLEVFAGRIVSCRVLLQRQSGRRRTGDRYNVRIELAVPGSTILIKRQSDATLLTAAQEAFRAAARRLQDRIRKQRGDIKLSRTAPRGVVTRLLPSEGYGFLTTPDGREIYFDRHSVLHGAFDRLEEGAEVRYAAEPGDDGPQASTVAQVTRRG